jgi:hypothetical protein
MLKNKTLRLGFFGAVLLILAVSVLALNFKAHAAAPSATTTTTVHAHIVKSAAGFVFGKPKMFTSLTNAFDFINNTTVSQTVTLNGQGVATIASHASAPYIFTQKGTYVFGLASNPKAALTVIVQ